MAFFEDHHLESLAIDRMVFHLVGPRDEDFVRLEEIHPGKFASFFLDRIRSIGGGIPYGFSDASATRERLNRIAGDHAVFQIESERLAEDFQRKHGGTTAAGAFLLFILSAGVDRFFALLKYDDETVLTYDVIEGDSGRKRVTLDALERTFVQNRSALQKAALVKLHGTGGELSVLDRQNQQKVARYFENFLDAIRIYDDADATEKLVKVTREVIRQNKDLVPEDVYREVTRRTYSAASAGGTINTDGHKAFLDTVMGRQLPEDDPVVSKFQSGLKRARIDGVPITLNAANVAAPTTRKIITRNQIQIRVPLDVNSFVTVEKDRIVINDTVEREYDDTERAR